MADDKQIELSDAVPSKYKWVGEIAKAITFVSERLGLGLFLSLVGLLAFDRWSSVDQKHRLVEMLVFGNGIRSMAPFVAASGIFLAVLFGQQRLHNRKVSVLQRELATVADAKSALEQQLADPIKLQHAAAPVGTKQKPKGKKT